MTSARGPSDALSPVPPAEAHPLDVRCYFNNAWTAPKEQPPEHIENSRLGFIGQRPDPAYVPTVDTGGGPVRVVDPLAAPRVGTLRACSAWADCAGTGLSSFPRADSCAKDVPLSTESVTHLG